jgi:hypothetical protein
VAVRGLLRSQTVSFGFDLDRAMLVDTDLSMAGYKEGTVAPTQRRMIDALQTISGIVAVAMALLGVLGTWIPAQRALSVNPLTLLREA